MYRANLKKIVIERDALGLRTPLRLPYGQLLTTGTMAAPTPLGRSCCSIAGSLDHDVHTTHDMHRVLSVKRTDLIDFVAAIENVINMFEAHDMRLARLISEFTERRVLDVVVLDPNIAGGREPYRHPVTEFEAIILEDQVVVAWRFRFPDNRE